MQNIIFHLRNVEKSLDLQRSLCAILHAIERFVPCVGDEPIEFSVFVVSDLVRGQLPQRLHCVDAFACVGKKKGNEKRMNKNFCILIWFYLSHR